MSNSLAIWAVTSAFQKLLVEKIKFMDDGTEDPELKNFSEDDVTAMPLDKAGNDTSKNKINLFMYQAVPNSSLRNMEMPKQVRSGELSQPPLALNLNYLITAYGKNNDDTLSHRLLGRAMRIMHDNPVLGAGDLFPPPSVDMRSYLSLSGLDLQPERVRFTPVSISLDEMSKLWTAFQTQYRISAAYQAAVILIESARPVRSRPPVMTRGKKDKGAEALSGGAPILEEVLPPNSQPSARLGEILALKGKNLDSQELLVRFSNLRLKDPIDITPLPDISATRMEAHIEDDTAKDPNALDKWIAGFYTVSLVVKRQNLPGWCSNELSFSLAPTITVKPKKAPDGNIALTVTCIPRIKEGQRVVLLFGESQIPVQVENISTPVVKSESTTIRLSIPNAKKRLDPYPVRLRVDGADSLPFAITGTPPRLEYDPDQMVTVT